MASIESIRQQYNIPKTVPDNQVQSYVKQNYGKDIVIDFTSNGQSTTGASTARVGNGSIWGSGNSNYSSNGSIFGSTATPSYTAASATPATTTAASGNTPSETPTASQDASSASSQKNIEYKNGKVIVTRKDGTKVERLPMKGEPGYVKDGESIEERIKRYFPTDYAKADTPEKKAQLIQRYLHGHFESLKGKSPAERAKLQMADYEKLIRNSGTDDEWAKIMGQSLHALYNNNKARGFRSGMDHTRTDREAVDYVDGVMTRMGDSDAEGQRILQTSIRSEVDIQNQGTSSISSSRAAQTATQTSRQEDTPESAIQGSNGKHNNVEYKDGKVIVTRPDGTKVERLPMKGEPGYVKDGESIEERIQRYFPGEYAKADTPEKKAKLIQRYLRGHFESLKNKSPEERARLQMADYQKLIRNSGTDSEWAQIMGHSVHALYNRNKAQGFRTGMDHTRTDREAVDYVGGVMSGIGDSDAEGQRILQGSIQEQTDIQGHGSAFSRRVAQIGASEGYMDALKNRDLKIQATEISFHADADIALQNYEQMRGSATLSDENRSAISVGSAHASADGSLTETQRGRAAKNSASYTASIKDADMQRSTYNESSSYINQYGSDSVKQSYNDGLAEHAYEFHESNRDTVINDVKNSGYESSNKILSESEQKYKESKSASSQQSQSTTSSSSTGSQIVKQVKSLISAMKTSSGADATAAKKALLGLLPQTSAADRRNFILNLSPNERREMIENMINFASVDDLKRLMIGSMKQDILKYLISHRTPENNAKLRALKADLGPQDRELYNQLEDEYNKNRGNNINTNGAKRFSLEI